MMTHSEQQDMKAILGTIFGKSMVAHWNMNEDKRKIYLLCNEAVKAKYRSMFEMASQGVLH